MMFLLWFYWMTQCYHDESELLLQIYFHFILWIFINIDTLYTMMYKHTMCRNSFSRKKKKFFSFVSVFVMLWWVAILSRLLNFMAIVADSSTKPKYLISFCLRLYAIIWNPNKHRTRYRCVTSYKVLISQYVRTNNVLELFAISFEILLL